MKRIFWVLLTVILFFLMYYLFFRPFEYEVHFQAGTTPGDLIETIRIWNRSLDNAQVAKADSLNSLKQTIALGANNYVYKWNFTSINDSLTKVNVQILQKDRSLINKLLIPFTDQQIEKDASTVVGNFYKILKKHLEITKVKIIGAIELDSSFCACTSLETMQIEKANGMMKDYPLLMSFINEFKLKPAGVPFLRISEWDHNRGWIKFDFCFPLIRTDSIPKTSSIVYKTFPNERVLKAVYHGNYITSDRAWYELMNYAKNYGYKITGLPIEYFQDNPNMGFNESQWKAEIFLPISRELTSQKAGMASVSPSTN